MRSVDVEPSRAELIESNRKYLLLVVEHHPELAHMVPPEMLIQHGDAKQVKGVVKRTVAPAPKPKTNFIAYTNPIEAQAAEVAERHDISVDELIGPSVSRYFSQARGEFIVACRKLEPQIAYQRIGEFMSGRNFSTIIHHEKKYLAAQGAA
jgi:hypothetical protein